MHSSALLPAAELLSFLKHTDGAWTEPDLSKALNISSAEAKQAVAASEGWMSSQAAYLADWISSVRSNLGSKKNTPSASHCQQVRAGLRHTVVKPQLLKAFNSSGHIVRGKWTVFV
jgi:hypothetical protein